MSKRRTPFIDRISDLPSSLIENILTRLTLRDAVKTSILSTKWRNKWLSLTHLKFDQSFRENFIKFEKPIESEFLFKTIYQVLLLHSNHPIHNITFYIPFENRPEIDTLLYYLSNINTQGLCLYFIRHNQRYEELSSALFSCLQLRYLELSNCNFYPQPAFVGFKHLSVLRLRYVRFRSPDLEVFITKCPLLETLILEGYNLVDYNVNHTKMQINEFFTHIPLLKELKANGEFLRAMAREPVPKRLLAPLSHLKCVTLNYLSFSSTVKDFSFTLCLISSSPNLTTLKIDQSCDVNFYTKGVEEFLGSQDLSTITFNQLQEVTLWRFRWTQLMMEFVKIILAKSPLLRRLHIEYKHKDVREENRLLKELVQLLQLQRASPTAKITFDSAGV